MLNLFTFLALYITHSQADIIDLNGLNKRINLNSESVQSFRKLLHQQQDCSEFGEGCRRCRRGTCRRCFNGYTLVYDEVNGYDICVLDDPATPSPTSSTPCPTLPTEAPTSPTPLPTSPTTPVTNPPTGPYSSPTLPTSSPTPPTPAPILPTDAPTDRPTDSPTDSPTDAPTDRPTDRLTDTPTDAPTDRPTDRLTDTPTDAPTDRPTDRPTGFPSNRPTREPTSRPTDTPLPAETGGECVRYRKAWHTLTEAERLLYIDGWLALHSQGIILTMSDMHLENIVGGAFHAAHRSPAFLPWHRYFIWELETAFRSLGGDWECFSLPYWDWGHDALAVSTSVIYSTGLSRQGAPLNSNCVQEDFFDSPDYEIHGSCLQRSSTNEVDLFGGRGFDNSVELITDIVNFPNYATYRVYLENSHNWPHCAVGGNMCTGISPDDPLFYLHHSYIDFLWAVWQDCHDYDLVAKEDLDNSVNSHIYTHGDFFDTELDDLMDFDFILNEPWSVVSNYNPTMRDVHSIVDWDVKYDVGSFWSEAGVENVLYCENSMNTDWFDSSVRRRMEAGYDDYGDPLDSTASDYLDEQRELINSRQDLSTQEKRDVLYNIGCEYSKNNIINNGWESEICDIPDDFEDCSDLEQNLNADEKRNYKISLNALLNRRGVRDSNCLRAIRTRLYPWLEMVGGLLDLCDGRFDPKC